MAFLLSAISGRMTGQMKVSTQNHKPSEEMTTSELCDTLEEILRNETLFHTRRHFSIPRGLAERSQFLVDHVDCRVTAKLGSDGNMDVFSIRKCEKMKSLLFQKVEQAQTENRHFEQIKTYSILLMS